MGKWDKYKVRSQTGDTSTLTMENKWDKYKSATTTEQPTTTKSTGLFGLGNIPITEQKISNRPSFMEELIQDPQQNPFLRTKEHPFKTLGAGAEIAEAIPADIMLALQRGKPQEIMSDIGQSLSGQRPAQLGDVSRAIGVPEPTSAGMGLLASGGKYMPTELFSGGIMKGLGKATQLPKYISNFGKPFMSKTMSIMSGIPEPDVAKAIERPEFLSKSWITKQKPLIEDMYKNQITPYVQNLANKVKTATPEIIDELDNIKLEINKQPTRLASTMKLNELDDVIRWMDKLKKPNLTLNETDAIIGEIDIGLGKVYKAKEKAKLEPITSTYQALSTKLRGLFKQARDKSHPEMADKFKAYSEFKVAERIYDNFDRWQPKLLNMAVAGAIAGPIGQAMGLPWSTISGITMGATIPKFQAMGIKGGAQLGKEVTKSSAIPLLSAMGLAKENK